jgi:hypothetical protein
MASLPYMTSPGNIDRALTGIKNAAVPARVSQDFVKTILKVPGGSGDQMTSFLRKLGLANSDGSPTDLYKKFRNPASSGQAIATAIRGAYAPLYIRNEFMHELNEDQLLGLIVEETGDAHDSNPVKLILRCIKHLKAFADFSVAAKPDVKEIAEVRKQPAFTPERPADEAKKGIGFNLGYTINLNLPATSDAAVFDAIFRSLRQNLLTEDDG